MDSVRQNLNRFGPKIKQVVFNTPSVKHKFSQPRTMPSQIYDNFLVLDFEATCDQNRKIYPQEIIEFPCLQVKGCNFQVNEVYHQYIRPVAHPTLSPFCTDLTGILQEMVDDEPQFNKVLPNFETWLVKHNLFNAEKNIFVTCGDWDLKVALPDQCKYSNLSVPESMKSWINIKRSFAKATGHFPRGINDMLRRLNLTFVGRPHSGIDDCRNIVTILQVLADRGFVFEMNGQLQA